MLYKFSKASRAKVAQMLSRLTLEEKASLCSGRDWWNTVAFEQKGLGSIAMSDGPHGLRRQRAGEDDPESNLGLRGSEPATCFPTAAALGCSFDRQLVNSVGAAIATEAIAQGVSLVLGPGINIKRSPLCGRNFEYYSEDPLLAGDMGAALIEGIQSTGAGACLKHFAANSQETRRMASDSLIDRRALFEIYLSNFERAIKQSRPDAVMCAYNMLGGVYCSDSKTLLTDILRDRFGFDGLVISDWSAVNDRVAGIRAGLDLEMPGKDTGFDNDILEAVREKRLDEFDLERCVSRVLAFVMGKNGLLGTVSNGDYDAHHLLARRASALSCVLLKNEDNILPLHAGEKIAVIGLMATAPRYQGAGSSLINPTRVDNAFDTLGECGLNVTFAEGYNPDGSTNDRLIADARAAAEGADKVICFVGLPDALESEGYDRADMQLPEGMLKLIDCLYMSNKNLVVTLSLGAPVELPFASRVKALLLGYLGGQGGGSGMADVLTGRVTPGGKLAESWPKKLADTPSYKHFALNRRSVEYCEGIYVGYRYYQAASVEPAFCFGKGLSYTNFRVDSCSVDTDVIKNDVVFSFVIENCGSCSGSETVQLYAGYSSLGYRQLIGFERVYLQAGERRAVSITVKRRDFCYFNVDTDSFELANEDYEFLAGTSSEDIFFTCTLHPDGGIAPPYYIVQPTAPYDMDHERFVKLLGFTPSEPRSTPYTLSSTIRELRATFAGKLLWSQLQSTLDDMQRSASDAEKAMMELSFQDMPLRSLVSMSSGMLSRATADTIVLLANRKLFAAVGSLLRSKKKKK